MSGSPRRVADEFSDRLLVGEVYVLDQARLAKYAAPGRLQLAHDFSLMREAWSADGFRRIVDTHEAVAYAAWLLNHHDHPRAVSRFDDADGAGQARARLAAVMLLTLRCTPFLSQGEELGLADSPIPHAAIVDVAIALPAGAASTVVIGEPLAAGLLSAFGDDLHESVGASGWTAGPPLGARRLAFDRGGAP